MASLTGQLVAETYKALLKLIDNDILTASEKQITDGFGGGSNVFIDSQGFLRANKYKVTNGLATQFLKADGSLDANSYLTSITGAQVITALGYTPVPTTRTITINGETHNLAADNTWTIGGTAAIWGNIAGTLSNQTDLQNALNAKFDDPTGTISQYIRGDGSIANFPTISGGLPTGGTAGQILSKIDATDYNAHWIDNYATQTKNEVKLGATLAKGAAVYVSSANGTNMIVSAASNTTEATSSKTFGLLETGGVTNDQVKCVTFGLIAGLDTSTATAGDPVWLGVNGALIFGLANKPVAPAHMVYIGVVTRVQSNNGEIFVNVQNGFELNELHDVLIQSVANNQGLFYESSTSLWKNKSIATVLGYTPQAQLNGTGLVRMDGTTVSYDNDPYPSGSGSIGYISKWNTATGLGNSSIYESSGSIGLNTTNVNYAAYGRAFTGGSFSTSSFGYEIASAATANGGLLGGLAYILIANDASRRIGAKIESNVSGTTATNLGADLRFYVKPDNAALGEIARMTASGITFYADLTATNITATSFIKSGGLSNQFLMADGSVTTYTNPVTGTGSAGYIPKWTTAANIGSSLIYDDGTSIGIAYSTPNKGGYGRTLTGAAFGSASFGFEAVGGTTTNGGLVGGLSFILSQNDSSRLVGSAIQSNLVGTTATNYGADLRFYAKADAGVIGEVARMTSAGLRVYGTIIKDGGTSSQYLMANGSVSTGPDLSGYLPLTGGTLSGNLTINSSTDWNAVTTNNGSGLTSPRGAFFVSAYPSTTDRYYAQFSGNWQSAGTWALGVRGTADNSIYLAKNNSGVLDLATSINFYIGSGLALHSGNYSSYALPLTGGTMSGVITGNGGGNFYIYNYARIGLPNAGRILYNNGTGANMFFGEIASDVYGFTGNLYSDTPTISMNVSSKRVGIGTASAQVPLDIFSETTSTSNVVRYSYNSAPGSYFLNLGTIVSSGLVKWTYDQVNAGTTYANVMTFDRGSVVFGGVNPTGKLTVQSGADGNMFSIRGFIAGYNYPNVVEMGVSGADGYINVRDGAGNIQSVISGYSGTPNYFNASVLIGTNVNAGYKLDVQGSGRFYLSTYQQIQTYFSSPYTSGFKFSDLNGQIIFNAGTDNLDLASNNATGGNITFTTASTIKAKIFANGNTTIGTTTDSGYKLDVNGTGRFANDITGGTRILLPNMAIGYWDSANSRIESGSARPLLITAYAQPIYIGQNGSSNFTIATDGSSSVNGIFTASAGINFASTVRMRWGGNNTPALGFPFGGSDTGNSLFIEAADGDTGGIAINNDGVTVYGAADTGFVFRAIDEDSYQSGVGLAAATTFQVNQGTSGGGSIKGDFTMTGSAYANAFYESSDFRLKTLIEHNPIVDGIENLQAKLYTKNGKTELGYFAQDAEKLMPYAVEKGADGFLSLSYREIHTAKIARLEKRVAELEKQLNLN